MNKQMQEILQKREQLLHKIEVQRQQLGSIGKQLDIPFSIADRFMDVLRVLRAYPALLAAVGALFVVHRRGTFALIKLAWRLWKGYRYLNNLAQKIPFIRKKAR